MSEVITVASFDDLLRDDALDVQEADAIAAALDHDDDVDVVRLPRPLAEENVLEAEQGTDTVFVVDLDGERETGDTYYGKQARRTAWLPKGATRIYVQADDADVIAPESAHEQEESADA